MNSVFGSDSGDTVFEDVPGFEAQASLSPDDTDDQDLDGPDHPDYPPASDDLDIVEPLQPCGVENRRRIGNTSEYPWSAICYLILHKGGKKWRGSGFFISPDTVVTAGHCIYSPRSGQATKIQVIPGRDQRNWPFGSAASTEFYAPSEWMRGQDPQFDYGAVKLSSSTLGNRTGHFTIANLPSSRIRAANLNTAGYPSDITPSSAQHFNGGRARKVYDQRIYYLMDTWFGASGSPVWIKTADGQRLAVGIHNYGHCPNKASRINTRVYTDLLKWSQI